MESEKRKHQIEGGVGKRHVRSVAESEVSPVAQLSPCDFHHCRRQIDTGDSAPGLGEEFQIRSGAAADLEHLHALLRSCHFSDVATERTVERLDDGIVDSRDSSIRIVHLIVAFSSAPPIVIVYAGELTLRLS